MKRVYIDTNIYLRLYALKEEWQLLDRVKELVNKKQIQLIFPKFIFNEISRNVYGVKFLNNDAKKIESVLTISLVETDIKRFQLNRDEIKKLKEELEKTKRVKLLAIKKDRLKYAEDFLAKISDLHSTSQENRPSAEQIAKAKDRQLLGDPPSKITDPIGDNLIWQIILDSYSDSDLYLVSNDLGWKRDNFTENLHPILEDEWKEKTSDKKITLLTSIADLIDKLDPQKPVNKEVAKKEKASQTPDHIVATFPFNFPVSLASASAINPGTLVASSDDINAVRVFSGHDPNAGIMAGTSTFVQGNCSRCGGILNFRPSYCQQCGFYNG